MLLPFQERVIAEKQDLRDRLTKLGQFIGTVRFNNLDAEEQSRLRRQYFHMASYQATLKERIEHFVSFPPGGGHSSELPSVSQVHKL